MAKVGVPQSNSRVRGYYFGVLAAAAFATYVLINRYVYLHYKVNDFSYVTTFMLVGGLSALFATVGRQPQNMRKLVDKHAWQVFLNGLIASVGLGIFVFGQAYTTASNASILATSTVLTTIIFSTVLLKQRLKHIQQVWLLVFFSGLYLAIIGFHRFNLNGGDLLVLGSSLILGFSNTFSKILMSKFPSQYIADVRLFSGGLLFLIVGICFRGLNFIVTTAGIWPVLAGFIFWVTIRCFYKAVEYLGPTTAVVLANSHPVVTPLVSFILLSEPYAITKFVGAILILLGVYFSNQRKPNN